MTSFALEPRSPLARTLSGIVGLWGGLIGLLPHVLHHVGPLAGTALLAGVGGTALFAGIGLLAAIPFLLRLHRRFHTSRGAGDRARCHGCDVLALVVRDRAGDLGRRGTREPAAGDRSAGGP